jgi:hypothetical protein
MATAARLRVIASSSDHLAGALVKLASEGGWSAEHLTHGEAVRDTTVEVDDAGVSVRPPTALYLRPPFEPPPLDRDKRFLFDERLALLWAAAALNSHAVLNRPSRYGLWGRATPSARVTEHRAGYRSSRPEVFCTHPGERQWPGTWAAERGDGIVGPWPTQRQGPFRARPVADGEQYEAVTVVRTQAWRRSDEPLAEFDLERRSTSIARTLRLDFAVLWWAIPPAGSAPTLARVAPTPSLDDVGRRWPEIGSALLGALSS